MRLVATAVIALLLSVIAGALVWVLIGVAMHASDAFVLFLLFILPVAIVCAVIFLVAWARPEPARAINRSALTLLVLFAVLLAGASALELVSAPTPTIGYRGVELMAAGFVTFAAVAIAQWAVFRLGRRGSRSATATRFGRPQGT